MKTRAFLSVLLGLFLLACSDEKKDVKDLNDILPDSKGDYSEKGDVLNDNSDTLKLFQRMFAEVGMKLDSVTVYDEDLFPDRVGPETTEKYRLVFGDEVVVFAKWKFSDSLRVTTALFNWADCFGPNCRTVVVGEEKNLQRNAFQIQTNDTVLIYLESSKKIDQKAWESYFEKREYELNWDYQLEQTQSGRVRWFTYMDEEKKPIKKIVK